MSQKEVQGLTLGSNPQHTTFTYKCYLRLPNMRSVIYNVTMGQTVIGLKSTAKRVFDLSHVQNEQEIKLVVNEVELKDGMDLSLELFNNAIMHVIVPPKRQHKTAQENQQEQQQTLTLRIKQPPVKCPILTLPWIPLRLTIKSLKSRILQFYRRQYFDENISKLDEDELYLVYGGRVMLDDKMLEDYDVTEDGVVYVVNGRLYVKQVTREEAERRINQIKGLVKETNTNQIQETTNQIQKNNNEYNQSPKQQQQISSSPIELTQQVSESNILNIVQSIVHDEDSQVQGETAHDLNRSQRFIQRYDSKTGNIIEESNSNEVDEFLTIKKSNSFKAIDEPVKQQTGLSNQERISVDSYLISLNHQVADYTAIKQLQLDPLIISQQEQVCIQNQTHDQQTIQQTEQGEFPQKTQQEKESSSISYRNNNDEMLM